jgi:hemoglobin-like flavoprotein
MACALIANYSAGLLQSRRRVDVPKGSGGRGRAVAGIWRDDMDDSTADIRRRVLIEASLLTHDEWTATVRTFYRRVLLYHPKLAGHFAGVDIDAQVQMLVAILSTIARDLPDRSLLDRVLFHLGVAHVEQGIRHGEFTEFIALLADVLSAKALLVGPEEAYAVWYQELSAVATAMLLTSA